MDQTVIYACVHHELSVNVYAIAHDLGWDIFGIGGV